MKLSWLLCLFLIATSCVGKKEHPDYKRSGFNESYNNTGREVWQKPEIVLNLFDNLNDKTVADIGAGSGFFTFRLAEKTKKVIAVEIDQEIVDTLKKIIPLALRNKVEVRLATPNDPLLEEEEVDAVLIVNTYIYLDNRVEYLKNLWKGMKVGGKLVISDFKKKQTEVGPDIAIRVPLHEVEAELEEAGFQLINSDDTSLDYQYIVLAVKRVLPETPMQ
jgi:SAM-dependent methyltransferase